MFCKQCGKLVSDEDFFCTGCGYKLKERAENNGVFVANNTFEEIKPQPISENVEVVAISAVEDEKSPVAENNFAVQNADNADNAVYDEEKAVENISKNQLPDPTVKVEPIVSSFPQYVLPDAAPENKIEPEKPLAQPVSIVKDFVADEKKATSEKVNFGKGALAFCLVVIAALAVTAGVFAGLFFSASNVKQSAIVNPMYFEEIG